jgi:RNA recognition motif-containing protein
MNFTVFLGNLPTWVTADDIKAWLTAENLVADSVKVIRNHETQESKGFAFVEAPTADEMQAIIRRFDRAPLEDRLLRANPAQPSKGKDSKPVTMEQRPQQQQQRNGNGAGTGNGTVRKPRRGKDAAPKTAFGAELAKAL